MGHICITDHGTQEVKMAGYSSFLSVMDREEVEVNENVRSISSHLEETSFVNKDLLLLWPKRKLFPPVSGPAGEIPSLFYALSLNVSCENFKKTLFRFSQPRPPGLFPQKLGRAPHPFFKGEALGTRLSFSPAAIHRDCYFSADTQN